MDRQLLVERFGGRCQRCGYERCRRALHFHHTAGERQGPSGKVDLVEIAEYPDRFELLCANCHIEEHDRLENDRRVYAICLACGTRFPTKRYLLTEGKGRYCSKECAYSDRVRVASTDDSILTRIEKYLDRSGECWIWTGHFYRTTPIINITKDDGTHTPMALRRVVYRLVRGHEPSAKRIYTSCKDRRCVNPDHFTSRGGTPLV